MWSARVVDGLRRAAAWCLPVLLGATAWGQTPPAETSSGSVRARRTYVVQRGDTLAKIAKRFGVTVEQLKLANRRTHDLVRDGDVLVVSREMPTLTVSRKTFTLEVTFEGRLVKRYTVATGRGALTPSGTFTVADKLKNPAWYHGGRRIPFGHPENILGTRWMTLVSPDGVRRGYGIHGTTDPASIGSAASAGCIRMHNRDVEELFEWTPKGTKVRIVDAATVTVPAAGVGRPRAHENPKAIHTWVRALTVPNTEDGRARLKRGIEILKKEGIPNLATFPSARGNARVLYAGAFTKGQRDAAERLAERVRGITLDGEFPFRDAGVVTVAAQVETVPFIRNESFTVQGGHLSGRGAHVAYTIDLRIDVRLRKHLDALVDPEKRNMLPEIRALIRKMFTSELRRHRRVPPMDETKRRIRTILNALMGADVVEDVVFRRIETDV